MTHKKSITVVFVTITVALLTTLLLAQDDHAGHDHAAHGGEAKQQNSQSSGTDSHIGHDHAAHGQEAHDHGDGESCSGDHADGNIIEVTAEQQKRSGIKTAVAGPGKLNHNITLNGELSVNTELQVHHIARAAGIAEKVNATIGDYVTRNELLAVLDSAELAEAKSSYYEAFNETALSLIDLQRARTINENTKKLLSQLQKGPDLNALQKSAVGDMGEHRARLLSSYAEFITSKKAFERRQKLFKDRIISENDFLNAQSAFEKAQAEYLSAQDNTGFEITQKLYDAERQQRVNEFRLRTAERRLYILGLSASDIDLIKQHGSQIQRECTDETCKDCAFTVGKHTHPENEDSFSRIYIKARRAGTVIARNIELGEEVEASRVVFTIADLSNLWALLQAPARDISLVRSGMEVIITCSDGYQTAGRVLLVDPLVNEKSRTALVRVAVSNDRNRLRPGSFVTGTITIAADNLPLVVKRSAVQNVNGDNIVFVLAEKGFRAVDVKTGREDGDNIEIIGGLKAGTQYVSEGAFTLKSIMVTSGLDPHAGHGH